MPGLWKTIPSLRQRNLHSVTYLYVPKELPNEEVYYLNEKKKHHNKLEAMYMLLKYRVL